MLESYILATEQESRALREYLIATEQEARALREYLIATEQSTNLVRGTRAYERKKHTLGPLTGRGKVAFSFFSILTLTLQHSKTR